MINATAQKKNTMRNFATAAGAYDDYASVQKKTARELLAFTLPCTPERILEPGCGTGVYTGMLLGAFPKADLRCVDIVPEMLETARSKYPFQARFIEADAECCDAPPQDLISANATFQWFSDLEGTIQRYRQLLRPGGQLTFSFYGPDTYSELNEALARATDGEHHVMAAEFAPKSAICALLHDLFEESTVEEHHHHESFNSFNDLLRTIKYTGVRGHSSDGPPTWTPHALARTRRVYREIYGDIRATYQVFLCRGKT